MGGWKNLHGPGTEKGKWTDMDLKPQAQGPPSGTLNSNPQKYARGVEKERENKKKNPSSMLLEPAL